MSKTDDIRKEMTSALKAGDKPRKEALSLLLSALKNKEIDKDSLELEQRQLEEVWERQCAYYKDDIEYLIRAVTKFSEMLQETVVLFEKN